MKKETGQTISALVSAGIEHEDALALRRIAMTLHRWHELELGTDCGRVQRDEDTGKTYFFDARSRYLDPHDPRAWRPTPDRKTGALKRLDAIMARYPELDYYVQTDPRRAPLYILQPSDVSIREEPDAFYSRGIAVCK